LPLSKRPIDIALIVFFSINLFFITYIVDLEQLVIACCAGATATPNYLSTQPGKASPLEPRPQQPEQVAEECLRRLGTTPSFVSGTGNKWVSFLMQRVFSRKKAIEIMGDGMKKMYRIVSLLL
jgi:hypothetical protein